MQRPSRQRTSGVPSFAGNDRLKFTVEEQQAIRAAEEALGYGAPPRKVVGDRRRSRHPLLRLALLILELYVLSEFIVCVLDSVRSQEPAAETQVAPPRDAYPVAQSQPVPRYAQPVFPEEAIERKMHFAKQWQIQVELIFDTMLQEERSEASLCRYQAPGTSCAPSDDLKTLLVLASVDLTGRNDALRDAQRMREANAAVVARQTLPQDAVRAYRRQAAKFPYENLDVIHYRSAWEHDPDVNSAYADLLARAERFVRTCGDFALPGGTHSYFEYSQVPEQAGSRRSKACSAADEKGGMAFANE
jgi:hypothetical protein